MNLLKISPGQKLSSQRFFKAFPGIGACFDCPGCRPLVPAVCPLFWLRLSVARSQATKHQICSTSNKHNKKAGVLFANTVAGEALLATFITLTLLIFPAFILGFEMAVGLLQAFLFTILSAVYIGTAVKHAEHLAHH